MAKMRVTEVKGEIETTPVVSDTPKTVEKKSSSKERKTGRSKKYQTVRAKIDKSRLYPLAEAVALTKDTCFAKFDATVELHIVVKKTGLSVNVTLPHAAGRTKKIEMADETTLEKLKAGKVDFDVLLATPDMMPKLVPFARLLGPRGLMPNPKNGTVIKSKEDTKGFSANTVTIKTEKSAPVVHTTVGKVSQKDSELIENTEVILKALGKTQVIKAYLSSSMGPSVKIQVA